MSASRLRLAASRLLLGAAGLLVGLSLAEGLARLGAPLAGEELFFNAPEASNPGMYKPDRDLLLVPVPGFRGGIASVGYSSEVRFNALGLRGSEDLGAQPRWLVVGDSFALGAQVPEEKTFPSILSGATGSSFLNAGVDGYSTWQALGRYRELDSAVQATGLLLLFFLGNDLTDNVSFPRIIASVPPGPRALPQGIGQGSLSRFAFRHCLLFAYYRVWTQRRRAVGQQDFAYRRFREELLPFSEEGAPSLRALLGASEESLRQMKTETEQRGDRLLVVVAPPLYALSAKETSKTLATVGLRGARPDAPRQALLELLGRLEIRTCDLTDPLAESERQGDRPYLRFDGHWSSSGHAVVASRIRSCLETLPGSGL